MEKVIGVGNDAFAGVRRTDTAKLELRLIPYSRTPDQEFAKPDINKIHDDSWGNWQINGGWTEQGGGNPGHYNVSLKKWDNGGDGDIPWLNSISSTEAKKNFGEFISLRQDTEEYGFVINRKTRVVFLADTESITKLKGILEVPLAEIKENHPEVLLALTA